MKGFAFGQYYPAESVLHRMDPRAKVICAVAYIVASFLCKNTFSFVLLLVSAFALILISRIPMKVVLRSIKALIFIMAFTAVLNIFWIVDTSEGATPLVDFWVIKIYAKGLYHAVFILVRILAMVIGTGLFLTYTTTPIALTDALELLSRDGITVDRAQAEAVEQVYTTVQPEKLPIGARLDYEEKVDLYLYSADRLFRQDTVDICVVEGEYFLLTNDQMIYAVPGELTTVFANILLQS